MKTSHLIAGASAVLLLATMVGHFFLQVANVGIAGSTSLFLLFWVWLWMATTEQVDEDNARYDAKIARRSRFVEYIEGERRLMDEWEAAFGGYHLEDEGRPLRIEAGANNHPIIPDVVSSGGYEYRKEDRDAWLRRQRRSTPNPMMSPWEEYQALAAKSMMPPLASQLRRPLKTYSWEDEARCIGLSMNQHTYAEYQTFLADIRNQGKGLSQQQYQAYLRLKAELGEGT